MSIQNQYLDQNPSTDLIDRLTYQRNNQANIMGHDRAAIATYTLSNRFLAEFGPEDVKAFYYQTIIAAGANDRAKLAAEYLKLEQKYGNWPYNEPAGVAWKVAKSARFCEKNPIFSLISILDATLLYALSTYPEEQKKLAIQAILISQKYFLDQYTMLRRK